MESQWEKRAKEEREALKNQLIRFKKAGLKRFTAVFDGSGDDGHMEILNYEEDEEYDEDEEDEEDKDTFYFDTDDISMLANWIAEYYGIYQFEGSGSRAKLEVDLIENTASWETIWYACTDWERIGKLSFKEALEGIPENEHQKVLEKLESDCSSLIRSFEFFDPESYEEDLGAYGTLLENIADACAFVWPTDGRYIAEDDQYASQAFEVYYAYATKALKIDVKVNRSKRTIEVYQRVTRSTKEKNEVTLIED